MKKDIIISFPEKLGLRSEFSTKIYNGDGYYIQMSPRRNDTELVIQFFWDEKRMSPPLDFFADKISGVSKSFSFNFNLMERIILTFDVEAPLLHKEVFSEKGEDVLKVLIGETKKRSLFWIAFLKHRKLLDTVIT